MSKEFKEIMLELREKANLTQREVAAVLGVTDQTVSNWETGHRMPRLTPKQMLKLCQVLGCVLDDLANYEEKLKL
jgi:transcriptional regulator with XRE-family HTH domain